MKDHFKIALLGAIVMMIISFAIADIAWMGGVEEGKKLVRKDAIERGLAEYRIIDDEGKSEFFWKEIER